LADVRGSGGLTLLNRRASRMSHPKRNSIFAAAIAGLSLSAAQAGDSRPVETCPGAISWEREHQKVGKAARARGDQNQTISEAALLEDLRMRVEKDQTARKRWLADQNSEDLAGAVESMDAENLAWLRKLISEKGFPTAAQVGNEGVHFAWILLQHADQDPKLQSDLLPVLERRFSAGELAANELARITDRVLMASGKPQRYGTQFDWFAGDFALPEPKRLAEVDGERSKLGLMPLVDYVCTLRKARNALK
jgi:hypothetical protein